MNQYLARFNEMGSVPSSKAEWSEWISASETRNFLLDDPLVDWLNLHGSSHGFQRDDDLPSYDPRTDFTRFIFDQGQRFETAVIEHINSIWEVETVATNSAEDTGLETAARTFELMCEGTPFIHQGVLFDPPSKTYGAPDLLVRSDYIAHVFPNAFDSDVEKADAPGINASHWHYLVIDIKFTTLKLIKSGELGDADTNPSYKAQLFVYNRALGWTQGRTPENSFLLGRGWKQGSQGGSNCLDRLAPVNQNGNTQKRAVGELADEATHWIRELRLRGHGWEVLPEPTRPELYPNMGNDHDSPWHHAKKEIANELEELTLLWRVGPEKRRAAHQSGIFRWRDPKCSADSVGVSGKSYGPMLQGILEVNQSTEGSPVRPRKIQNVNDEWRRDSQLEFYVDFETVENLADDFSMIPEKGGQPLIFMIGCGHLEDGQWRFECFVADILDEPSEARIIDQWLAHMSLVGQRLSVDSGTTTVIHWAHAESSEFQSARARNHGTPWPNINWFDFLNKVVKAEPVVVRGSLNFGLKDFARALHNHGLIDTHWEDTPLDGMGAMVGAWWCHEEAISRETCLRDIDLMQDIIRYNEIDCKAMLETVRYLRSYH